MIDEVVRWIASVEPMPMEIHRLVVKLPISDFWATNYDALIETVDAALDVVEPDEALSGVDFNVSIHGLRHPQASGLLAGRPDVKTLHRIGWMLGRPGARRDHGRRPADRKVRRRAPDDHLRHSSRTGTKCCASVSVKSAAG